MSTAVITDSQVIMLLCAPLKVGDAEPLTVAQWADLATRIHRSGVGRPAALSELNADELRAVLDIDADLAIRIVSLLDRGGPLAFELERLGDRGLWHLTRVDEDYPARLRSRLGLAAPPVIFGAGPRQLLSKKAVAAVGSRDADDSALAVTGRIGTRLAREGIVAVSGGARGIDRAVMAAAMNGGGNAVGIIAESLVRQTQHRDARQLLADDQLALITPFAPDSSFAVWKAMARNKLIYCASDAAIVVAATEGSGGTWSGAIEALKSRWVPVWVWNDASAPPGNQALVEAGALSLGDLLESEGSMYDGLARLDGGVALPESSAAPDGADLFPLVWPRLEAFLETPRSEADLCDYFELQPSQVRAWLKRAVEAGLVVRKAKPVRYAVARPASDQVALFDS